MPHPYHYVYILRSQSNPSHHYIGSTSHLRQRLHAHNAGQSKHTSKHRPWFIETAIAFRETANRRVSSRVARSTAILVWPQ